jgi:hypothetical protein
MFTTDAGDYASDKVFRAKMLVILLLVIFTVIVQGGVRKWSELPVVPAAAKVIAFISLLLWLGAIFAGVDIAALSGLGWTAPEVCDKKLITEVHVYVRSVVRLRQVA